ncbi:MAG TPA: hypothetical protein V6D10_00725 [Trichocoleus sp.]
MPSPFARLLTIDQLHVLADDRSYQRGEAYFQQGQVRSLAEHQEVVAAQVEGTETYEVEFWIEDGNQLAYQCDCPVGIEGWFCKHCVAVGLAWLANPPSSGAKKRKGAKSAVTTMQDVQHYLEQQERSALVKLILDRAMKDAEWREQLLMKVAAAQPQGIDLKTFQRALKSAISHRGFVDYGEAGSYASGIEHVLDSIAPLIEQGHGEAVVQLCEYAVPLLEDALGSVDDSNGEVGSVLEQMQKLHYEACQQAKPDPIALAERLYELEMNAEFDTFYGAVNTYAEILGKTGIDRYRQLAEADWAEQPTLTPSQRSGFNSKRWRLTNIMEQLARQTGDVEAIVAVKRRDLSKAYTYLQIAQLYEEAKQPDRALHWAEEGLKAFSDRPDSRLQDFVVERYQQQGRFNDAMAIVWSMFTERPTLQSYQHLKTEADRGKQWAKWREKAIDHIRQQIERAKQQKQGVLAFTYRDHSLLVEVFIWEGEIELAWQEAQKGQCSKQLWLKLADLRQQDHPEDSLSLYMNEIEPLIQQTNNSAYAQAIEFLKKVKTLMLRLGLQSQFEQYREHLGKTYKAKRNFTKLLNTEKL